MAYEAGINQIALRIAEVIHRYAESKGWSKDDYHILMKYRTDSFILNVLVVARAFDGRSRRQEAKDYDELRHAINTGAGSEVKALNSFGLVLKGFEAYDLYWSPRLWPDEIVIDEKLINRGVSWSDPSHQVAH
jgi:hypothetical protein